MYTSSSPEAIMPREVSRANSKTTTQIARSHINVIFSGQWSKKAYVWL